MADFVRGCLNDMRGSVLDVLYDSHGRAGAGRGHPGNQLALRDDGRIGLASIKAKDPALFLFETDPFLNITAIRGLPALTALTPAPLPKSGERETSGGLAEGELPVEKFVIYPYQPSYANPMGTQRPAGGLAVVVRQAAAHALVGQVFGKVRDADGGGAL